MEDDNRESDTLKFISIKNLTHSWFKGNDLDTLLSYFLTVLEIPKT